jgi:diaminohydroxyphosphoribosylaminopyrimidine deaminase/5-amino-6-(5-phosphoribosylamino)uracil reductase
MGEPQAQITGEVARRHVQALRTRYDAILVGRGTIEADDPLLTVRLPGLEARSPIRIVLDSEGRLDPARRIFDTQAAPTWVITAGPDEDNGRLRRIHGPRGPGGLDLHACLHRLADAGVRRVLVEGGARLARCLREADLIDEIVLFRSPTLLGGDIVPALAGLPLSALERCSRFRTVERRRFGADRMMRRVRLR